MAAITGVDGSVSVTGQYATNVFAWALSLTFVPVETSAYGSVFRTYKSGVKSWRGTYRARMDDTAVQTFGSTAASGEISSMTLTATTGQTYAGAAVTESIEIEHEFDGTPNIVVGFLGTGALTIA